MSDVKNIPKHWQIKKLGEECKCVTGTTPPKNDPHNYGNDIPFVKPPQIFDKQINDAPEKLSNKGAALARILPINCVLVTCIGNLGRTAINKIPVAFNQQINAIIPSDRIDGKFLFYQAQSTDFRHQLEALSVATTVAIVNKGKFETIRIVIPPLAEQFTIVSKIEELLSDLDNGKQQLQLAQQQLKVYRQSLLKWAFEGKLTDKNVEEGELPKGWKLTNLGTVLNKIEAGKSFKCDERTPSIDEVGVLKVSAVTWQIFNEFESKTVFGKDRINKDYFVSQGDFLFSRANTLDLIGAVVIVNFIERNLMLSDKTLRFRFNSDVIPKYILYYLRSRKGRKEIQRLSTGNQESMRNIGQARIKQIEFPYCTKEEQQLVVNELESKLTVCDKIEETISQSLQQAETLRQSILKQAFEGKLVSLNYDSDDEYDKHEILIAAEAPVSYKKSS
jgi:type I restriction enzyme S subunit